MSDCIFCKIAAGEIPSTKVYEDDDVLAFRDINPQAPVHIVFVPKKHLMSSMNDITEENAYIVGKIMLAIKATAEKLGIINNCGRDAGQSVQHIHFHLLAGVDMGEKLV